MSDEDKEKINNEWTPFERLFLVITSAPFIFISYVLLGVASAVSDHPYPANIAGGIGIISLIFLWFAESALERTNESRYKWSFIHCVGIIVMAAFGESVYF